MRWCGRPPRRIACTSEVVSYPRLSRVNRRNGKGAQRLVERPTFLPDFAADFFAAGLLIFLCVLGADFAEAFGGAGRAGGFAEVGGAALAATARPSAGAL